MTTDTRDPVAALAQWFAKDGDPDQYDEWWTTDRRVAEAAIQGLAEQGYVLVPLDVIREVAAAGVVIDIPHKYIEVQIDHRTWAEVQRLVAIQEQGESVSAEKPDTTSAGGSPRGITQPADSGSPLVCATADMLAQALSESRNEVLGPITPEFWQKQGQALFDVLVAISGRPAKYAIQEQER